MNIKFKNFLSETTLKSLVASTVMLASSLVYAQTMPLPDRGAQELLLQQQRERDLREQMEGTPNTRLDDGSQAPSHQQKLPTEETPCFQIEKIQLIGEYSEKFQWAIATANKGPKGAKDVAIGKCLGSQGLNIVLSRVQNAIIDKGYITTRVFAAPQDLNSGTLTLTLVPGLIHAIRWGENSQKRTSWKSALPMREGDLLNLRDLEQALETFKRVPTADVDIQIEPAQQVGQSDLVIYWQQKFPFRVNLSIDDGGGRQTGRYQGAATISYDNWLTMNDLFYVSFNHQLASSQGGDSHGYYIHYSIPFKGNWLLSFNANDYEYEQNIAGINQTYVYSGRSRNLELSLKRLVYRDQVRRLNFYAKGWTRRSKNYLDDTEIQVQRRRTAGWEAGMDYRQFIGNAIVTADLSYRRGTGMNRSLRAVEEKSNEGTSRMKLLSLNSSISIPWKIGSQQFRYYGVIRAQWNYTPLVTQDRFSIGGRYTVRGFDGRNTLMGDRGWLSRNDIGWYVGKTGQELYVALDHGYVSGPSVRYQVGQNLTGMALGLRGWYRNFGYDVFVGIPLHKPDKFETSKYTSGFNINMSF